MEIALAQLNQTIGDFAGNEARILAAYRRGIESRVALVACPELSTTGYPPRDLLLRQSFIAQNLALLDRLAAATGQVGLLVGYVGENRTRPGREVTNATALLQNGRIVATRTKTLLPTYDVFDEDRYFQPAGENLPIEFRGCQLGLTICEDIWNDEDFWPERRYRTNPPIVLAEAGAEVILNLSASPWSLGKDKTRFEMLRSLAVKTRRPVLLCNQAGGNDELIFDGSSLAFNSRGDLIAHAGLFEEDFVIVDTDSTASIDPPAIVDEELVYRALVLGLRDYFRKCGFQRAVLGASGGIHSALVACLAVAALGADNVQVLSLPTQFSSQGNLDDARVLAERLGVQYKVLPIQRVFAETKQELKPLFGSLPEDTTEENIQARLRGMMLMALSNKFGSLLLTTGNKSELAVGYCTLYGDMCGGLAVISDVPKTMVYRLARWINRENEIIPAASITKPPSAELRPNQNDQDTLPPYDVLDAVLDAYVVCGRSVGEIIAAGFEEETVCRVVRLIDLNEYKRRQAAPGLKVTTKAFGMGRRIPIAQRDPGRSVRVKALRDPKTTGPPRLRLRVTAAAESILRSGHPWLFAESIRELNRPGHLGELAVIFDRQDKFLAVGLFDPRSPLRVRILHAGKPQNLDLAWWRAQLKSALGRRSGMFDDQTTGYRLINGESDGWPGLVLDRYGSTLVMKLYSAAWLPRLGVFTPKGSGNKAELPHVTPGFSPLSQPNLVALLQETGALAGNYGSPGGIALESNREGMDSATDAAGTLVLRLSRNLRTLAQGEFNLVDGQVLFGEKPPGCVAFLENGLRFEADVLRGQKTGFFLDQRENRRLVETLARGRAVLNAFSFSGGFSLYAARGGANSATDLDLSAHALDSASRNFALNQDLPAVAACRHERVQTDAFVWLAQKPSRQFGLIVLDPPSLAKREAERARAIQAYRRLNADGLRWLAPGGVLVSASCSAHVSAEEFFGAVRQAARESGRAFVELQTAGHPPDHLATFREGKYLKALYLRV